MGFPIGAIPVEDAHKINFLHRDLAPQNIFLTASGQLLVANFGISRTIQDALARRGSAEEARRALSSPQTIEGKCAGPHGRCLFAGRGNLYAPHGRTAHRRCGRVRAGESGTASAAVLVPGRLPPPCKNRRGIVRRRRANS
ncbi:MAG: protein kinase [Chthoniobacter sp.]